MRFEFPVSLSGAAQDRCAEFDEARSKGGAVEGPTFEIRNVSTLLLRTSRTFGRLRVSHPSSAHRGVYFLFVFLLAACAPAATPPPELQIVSIYTTPATQPWLADAFACAPPGAVIRVADLPAEADLSLRLGEPELLLTPAYQIDIEEILVVTHRQSPLQNMTVDQIRELFVGQGDPSVQVWVYAGGEDVQGVFEQTVLQGRSVTSLARLAVSPQQMSETLNNEPNAVGILPRRWKAGDPRIIYSIPDVPVLAVVKDEPQGVVRDVIACLQE